MDSGFYAACAGLVSRMEALDVLSNNLANANTDGYKAEREFYSALDASIGTASLSPLNQAMNRYGVVGGQWLDLNEGSIVPTGNKLDLAIQGAGFFSVQTASGIRYTRNGNFHLDAKRRLVTEQGELVLGPPRPGSKQPEPIQVPAGAISISGDGTVSVNGAMVGKLRIIDFPKGTQITPVGDAEFTASAGAARFEADPSVREGALEASNMNAISGMVSLILTQRSAEMLEKALSIFNNDFDQTAQSLGQV
jgi:flagellar basal-body rod protein FlgF/flagellar basal-body rod protein FlgG